MMESMVLAAEGRRRVLAVGVAASTMEEVRECREGWAEVLAADVAEVARMLIVNPTSLRCVEVVVGETEDDKAEEEEVKRPKVTVDHKVWAAYGTHTVVLFIKNGMDIYIISINVPRSIFRTVVATTDREMAATGGGK